MGAFTPTNQSNPTSAPQGKGMQSAQPMQQQMPVSSQQTAQSDGIARPQGKGGNVTYPGQGGQPQMGKPNTYSNTVGPWDNANVSPQQQAFGGKGGKGGGYQTARTNYGNMMQVQQPTSEVQPVQEQAPIVPASPGFYGY